ncbi:flavodoxin family protein [Thalassotalea profundi]|uniref:NADPH-dependent FMN reductase-like domain-containing protein n=1 Tax=Thalassotalea profundi TaxID=2036687 RepID=A0ABQ3IFR8_9GAMM|nr:NAD(P)H-dependent oxidoreductase [Thalassotalea profundi]GHE79366.1 hypothetical protein GCM10011501_04230 [Thalassotalea profundi]
MSTAILLGTSRQHGNTHQLINLYLKYRDADVFNLMDYSISVYDYEHNNKEDDFLKLTKQLLKYDHIIFATPVYWYSMSASMKIFFDRLSDLLTIEKKLGKQLRDKSCSVLATGVDSEPPDCFEQPFILTAKYLGMNYENMLYCACNDNFNMNEHLSLLLSFINKSTK